MFKPWVKSVAPIVFGLITMTLSPITAATEEGFKLAVGGFYSTSDSGMEVTNPSNGEEFTLDFETDLQLVENEFLPFLEMSYWFNENHGLYFDWKRLHRNANNTKITVPYEFEDVDTGETYQVKAGADLTTIFNVDIARIGYGYDFYSDDNFDLIATIGLHVMWMKLSFEGEFGACLDDECRVVEVDPDNVVLTEVTAPLPDIGLLASYKFAPNWRVSGHIQYFYIKVDEVKGQLVDFSGGVSYEMTDSFAVDLSYKYYDIDVEVQRDYSSLDIYYGFKGPMLTLAYHF
ncbi:hypothetical protein [Shewanella colwelliana]|nr:hypothetical protein [Shewanella colwelliana]